MENRTNHPALRIGLIGAGRIVERVHLPLLREFSDIELAGLYDPDFARAQELAENFGIQRVCRNVDELWDLNLNATLVACPNHLHAEMSIAALQAGTHVICEKPMATCVSEAEAMLRAADQSGRELMIAFTNRFRPEVIALHEAISKGELGDITAIRCGWLRHNGVPGTTSWFTKRARSGGGVLIDLGSHLLDLVIWLTERRALLDVGCLLDRTIEPRAQADWYSASQTESGGCDVEVGATAFAIFEGRFVVSLEVSWAANQPQDQTYIHVLGKNGEARLKTLFGLSPNGERPMHPLQISLYNESTPRKILGAIDLLQPYRKQWKYFFDSLRSGRSLRSSLDDGLAVTQLIAAMYNAAEGLERAADVSSRVRMSYLDKVSTTPR